MILTLYPCVNTWLIKRPFTKGLVALLCGTAMRETHCRNPKSFSTLNCPSFHPHSVLISLNTCLIVLLKKTLPPALAALLNHEMWRCLGWGRRHHRSKKKKKTHSKLSCKVFPLSWAVQLKAPWQRSICASSLMSTFTTPTHPILTHQLNLEISAAAFSCYLHHIVSHTEPLPALYNTETLHRYTRLSMIHLSAAVDNHQVHTLSSLLVLSELPSNTPQSSNGIAINSTESTDLFMGRLLNTWVIDIPSHSLCFTAGSSSEYLLGGGDLTLCHLFWRALSDDAGRRRINGRGLSFYSQHHCLVSFWWNVLKKFWKKNGGNTNQ